ncbi:MAG: hypothetical protein ACTSVL_11315 [Promethearchaeota archaeon]
MGNLENARVYLEQTNIKKVELEQTSQWNYHFAHNADEIDFSIEIPVSNIPDYDVILPMTDGIIYFLNPNRPEERELFQESIKIMDKLERRIPGVILFNDPSKIILESSNHLFKSLWESSSNNEGFILNSFSFQQFPEILQVLSDGIISGKPIINFNIAWIQLPILMNLIDLEINKKNWTKAAIIGEKIVEIKQYLEHQDWQIIAEKTAILYEKSGDLLKAGLILQKFNPVGVSHYKNEYYETLILKAEKDNLIKDFKQSAKDFEKAANWARIELTDNKKVLDSTKNAMLSWIAAAETQYAFALIENFPLNEKRMLLDECTERISVMAEDLLSQNQPDLAKAQLYLCFTSYQKLGLFESIKKIALKSIRVLKRILEKNIKDNDVDSAKLTLDELYNIWETFEIKSENIDHYLIQIGQMFIEKHDFQKVEIVLVKIQSSNLKEKLTQLREKKEDQIKQAQREGTQKELFAGIQILDKYLNEEHSIFAAINQTLYDKLQTLTIAASSASPTELSKSNASNISDNSESQSFVDSSMKKHLDLMLKQYNWLRSLTQDTLSYEILDKLLITYLKGIQIQKFINNISRLPEALRKKFLKSNIELIEKAYGSFEKSSSPHDYELKMIKIIQLFRNHLLYEESRHFAQILNNFLINCALKLSKKVDKENISDIIAYTLKIENITNTYLDNLAQNLDDIYQNIIHFYIKSENFKETRQCVEKILNKELASNLYAEIQAIEEKISKNITSKVQEKQEQEIFTERLSQLEILSRDQKIASKNMLRMRNGLKRRYFNEALQAISENELEKAAQKYMDVAKSLVSTKKFELAGVCISISTMVLLILQKAIQIRNNLQEIRDETVTSLMIFNETFPIKVIDYILRMINAKDTLHLKMALKLFETLPLFPEEQLILDTLLGKDIDFRILLQSHNASLNEIKMSIPSNLSILLSQTNYNPALFSKRQALESKYWEECHTFLAHQAYEDSSEIYFRLIPQLINHNYPEFAITSLIMGFLTLLRTQTASNVYLKLEKYIFHFQKEHEEFQKNAPIQLLEILVQFWEQPNATETILDIGKSFQNSLHLLDWEKSYIESILSDISMKESSESLEKMQAAIASKNTNQDNSLLYQQKKALHHTILNISDKLSDLKEKRNKMIRTYYKSILDNIGKGEYEKCSLEYIKLAKRMARRNDFDASSLMLLLSVLSKIKAKIPLPEIQSDLENLLNTLGIIKKILDDYFGVKLSFFSIDCLKSADPMCKEDLKDLLSEMPLLNDELELLNF